MRTGKAYMGKGVTKAVANVNGPIAKALAGQDVTQQAAIDKVRSRVLGDCQWMYAPVLVLPSVPYPTCTHRL